MLQRTEATCALGDLTAITSEGVRTVQNWTEAGILKPLPATNKRGKGVHRAFPSEPYGGEKAWALMASALNGLYIPVHHIRLILDHLRKLVKSEAARDARAFEHSPFVRAMTTDDVCLLVLRVNPDAPKGRQIAVRFLSPLKRESLQVTEANFTARSPSAEEVLRREVEFLAAHDGRAVILDLGRVFEPLRKSAR